MYTVEHKELNFELKSSSNGGKFTGYASVFNIKDHHGDVVLPGSFGKLDPSSVKFFLEHKSQNSIGYFTSIREDKYGLLVDGVVQNPTIFNNIANGVINGMSIGFIVTKRYIDSMKKIRYLDKVKLIEISLVKKPANTYAICFPQQ